jgi:hypothetical protein
VTDLTFVGQWPDSENSAFAWDWYSTPVGTIGIMFILISSVYQRDLPLIQELNANLIRTYEWRNDVNHSAFLDECYNRGMYQDFFAE